MLRYWPKYAFIAVRWIVHRLRYRYCGCEVYADEIECQDFADRLRCWWYSVSDSIEAQLEQARYWDRYDYEAKRGK